MRRLARVGLVVILAVAGLSAAGPAPSVVEAVKSGDREAVRALGSAPPSSSASSTFTLPLVAASVIGTMP